ncbi:MAG: PPC domain-containing DNA-binding protein [bacterium]
MKIIKKENNVYMLRFDRGEELINGLAEFCESEQIRAGFFTAIGAAREVSLSWYDIDAKEYSDKEVIEKMEIIGMTGNIAEMEGKNIIHCHASFSDNRMAVMAGHVKRLVIAATAEVVLHKMEGVLEREHSEEIGLNLFK